MFISQSFQTKIDDSNNFSEKIMFSANSDYIYFLDSKGVKEKSLTIKTKELEDEDIKLNNLITTNTQTLQNTINKEIQDRIDAIAKEQSDRATAITSAIAQERKDTQADVEAEATLRQQAISKEVSDRDSAIDVAIAQEVINRDKAIEIAVGEETTERDNAILEMNSLISTNTADIETLQTELQTANENIALNVKDISAINQKIGSDDSSSEDILTRLTSIETILGDSEDVGDEDILTRLASIEAKITAIEARLDTLEAEEPVE